MLLLFFFLQKFTRKTTTISCTVVTVRWWLPKCMMIDGECLLMNLYLLHQMCDTYPNIVDNIIDSAKFSCYHLLLFDHELIAIFWEENLESSNVVTWYYQRFLKNYSYHFISLFSHSSDSVISCTRRESVRECERPPSKNKMFTLTAY